MIRAILRAQWLSMRSFRLASHRRGAVFSLATSILWYGFWTLLAFLAEEVTAQPGLRTQIADWLPIGLLAVFAYWQLAPLASASMGASLDLRKLLLYPVPRRSLFLVEVLLRVTTCVEMLLLLTGAGIGLLRNPEFNGWPLFVRAPLALAAFAACNLFLAAGLRNLIERLLSRRGMREVIGLLIMLAAVTPRLLFVTEAPMRRFQHLLPAGRHALWPWGAAAEILLGAHARLNPSVGAATLCAWIVFAYLFGRRQFESGLRYDIQEAQATVPRGSGRSWIEPLYRLPSLVLPDPVGAMVEKELRSLARTPRFRMVFVMGFSFGLAVWFPMVLRGRHSDSIISGNFLAVVSVYALTLLGQVTYWNAFGFDRSAAQIYFAAPVSFKRVLAAKNIASAVFIFLEISLVTLACSLLRLGITPGTIAETFIVVAVCVLYLFAIGNLSSVNYPRGMRPQRASGGAAGRAQGLLFLLYPVALLPVAFAYLARYAFSSQWAFDIALACAAALGAAIYLMAMESAVSSARNRREMIIAELASGEGPLAAD
ncbi:MAG TPA: hypothetical protein VMU80_06730, partial [Bryobacteraceae bacterium]|nr:hypothetical protein [Bryobacteraceae bacterium]